MLQDEVWEITQQYLDARRRGKWQLNTSNCFSYQRPCEYLSYCQSGFNPNVADNLYDIAPPTKNSVRPNPRTSRLKGKFSTMTLTLPTGRTKPTMELGKQSILLYAPPKLGKEQLCCKFPGGDLFECEPGLNHLEVFKVHLLVGGVSGSCKLIAKGDHHSRQS